LTDRSYPTRPHVGVLAVVRRGERLLLVQRSKPPRPGVWAFPGGAQELGETLFETAARELKEETGVDARPGEILTVLDFIHRDADGLVSTHWALVAVRLDWEAGEAAPLDEAFAVEWLTLEDIRRAERPFLPNVEKVAALALLTR
jgi:ADP-ribose pyrophosphatase YjhB (NUDIX family)